MLSDLVRDLTDKAKKYDSNDASKWLTRVSIYELMDAVLSNHR